MAKIVQILTRPSDEYDLGTAEAQVRDLDAIVEKLNTASLNSQNFKALIESGMSPEDVRKSFERDRDNQSRIRTEYKRLKSIKKKDEKKFKEFKKY